MQVENLMRRLKELSWLCMQAAVIIQLTALTKSDLVALLEQPNKSLAAERLHSLHLVM